MSLCVCCLCHGEQCGALIIIVIILLIIIMQKNNNTQHSIIYCMKPYAIVHFGSSKRKWQVAANSLHTWPLTLPVCCYRPNIHPSPCIITQPWGWYSCLCYNTWRRVNVWPIAAHGGTQRSRLQLGFYHPTEGGRLSWPRHCSKCPPAQSCLSQLSCEKHGNCLQRRFDPQTSCTAGKHAIY